MPTPSPAEKGDRIAVDEESKNQKGQTSKHLPFSAISLLPPVAKISLASRQISFGTVEFL